MEKSTSVLSKLMEDKQQHLGNSIENIDKVSGQLHEVTKNLNEFTVYLNTMTSKISPQRIDKMITETSAMVDNIARTFSDKEIGKVLKSIDSFVEASNVSVRKMESSFHDLEAELSKTLASLRESMENISRLTRELTEDPTSLLRKRAGKRSRK
ncbi:MAG: hypothetical protein GY765_05765 [bacterium]|nr:hypothetical protein [bacterium]